MSDRLRVLVADDSTLFRAALEGELRLKYEAVEGASCLDAVDAAFAREPIDVALIDMAWRDEGPPAPHEAAAAAAAELPDRDPDRLRRVELVPGVPRGGRHWVRHQG